MFKKLVSLLIMSIFLFGHPLSVLADQDTRTGNENVSAAGMGFFSSAAPRLNPARQGYQLRSALGAAWLTEDAIWLTRLEKLPAHQKGQAQADQARRGVHLKITFPGASRQVSLVPEQPLPGRVSLLNGPDPSLWTANLPVWGAVRYRGLYPGVDLLIRSTGDGFAWEYEAQPGADVRGLRLRVRGADELVNEASGALVSTALGDFRLPPLGLVGEGFSSASASPVASAAGAEAAGAEITGAGTMDIYPLGGAAASPALAASTALSYSTFLGGGSWDSVYDVALDSSGAAYLTGETASSDFPTTPGAFDTSLSNTDAFVMKLLPFNTGLVYATFIGGRSQDTGWSLTVENGVAYVGGETMSDDFPTTDGTNTFAGETDAFALAINSTGTGLVYSRLLGGSDQDRGYGIDVQGGLAYLTGITYSADFPGGGYANKGDVFVVKLTGAGAVSYARLAGGSEEDAGFGIAVANNVAWVTGQTWSSSFASNGIKGNDDVFVLSVNANGTVATKRTYGGANQDSGEAIVLDDAGDIYITGSTTSTDFPYTEGGLNGAEDAFLLEVNPENSAVMYAASLGGAAMDRGNDVSLDPLGGVVVAGVTLSSNFPVTPDAYQASYAGGGDAFVTRYFLAGSAAGHRTYSSYLGGSGYESISAAALDSTVYAYLVGETRSANFPITAGGLYQALNGTQDGFLSVMAVGNLPTVSIQKTTNTEDANSAPGPYVKPGSAIAWRYSVTNTGSSSLTSVKVTDNRGVTVSCPKASLAAAETMLCTASGTAVKGQYSNLGIVSAVTAYGTTVSAVDASHYFGGEPKVELVKKTNGVDGNTLPGVMLAEGSEVTWTYEISNTGNVPLSNVKVVDDNGTPGDPSDNVTVCTLPSLAAADAATCSLTGTARAGQYTNTAVVTASGPGSLGNVSDSDLSSYFGSAPAITLVNNINGSHVTAGPGPFLLVGSDITWKYDLVNNGNVALANVTVTDDNGTPGIATDDRTACTVATLAAGASTSCTLSGKAAAGQYHNTAQVSGTSQAGQVVTAQDDSYYFGAQPVVALEFAVNTDPADLAPGLYVLPGSTLNLSYQVNNAGNVPLANLIVTEGTTQICTITSLEVAASSTCSRTITALTGQQTAAAAVTAKPPSSLANVTASDAMYYFGAVPKMTLVKKTNNQDGDTAPGVYVLAGSTVSWTYTLTNTGNVPLAALAVVDDNGTPGDTTDDQTVPGCSAASLAVGGSITCALSGKAQVGQYANAARAAAVPPAPLQSISASDTSHYFGATLALTLQKQTNGLDAETAPGPLIVAGGSVNWTYKVTNNSNVPVNISIVDDSGTPASPADDVSVCAYLLAAGASQTCTLSGRATAGQYANTARATATPPAGLSPVTAQDTSHYFGVVTGVDINTYINGLDANQAPGPYIHVGDPVYWTYKVTNTGNVPLTGMHVTDDQGVAVTCAEAALQPAASVTCTASGVAAAGQYHNIGTVTANPPDGFSQVTDSDPSYYFGSTAGVSVQGFINGVDAGSAPGPYIRAGQPVAWKYVVTNTGNITLTNIAVTDDGGVKVGCPVTTLAPGAFTDCTASGTAVAGQYTSTGTVSAKPVGGDGLVYASDTSYYYGASPSVQIIKKINGEDANNPPGPYIAAGGAAAVTYEITNTGNVDLASIVVSDDGGLVAGCAQAELQVGQGMTCPASETALAGQQVTHSSVSAAASHNLGEVHASDLTYYYGYTLELGLVKKILGHHVNAEPGLTLAIGTPVTWTYEVTNQSNVALTGVTVTDNRGVAVSCPKTGLAIGETMICTGSGTVTEGQYSNVGLASAQFNGDTVKAEDASYYVGVRAHKIYLSVIRR